MNSEIDVLRLGFQLLECLQPYWLDEALLAIMLALGGFVIDGRRAANRASLLARIQENRLRVLKATTRSVQDIVGNFINSTQLAEMEAGDAISRETAQMLAHIKRETLNGLDALADLDSTPEIATEFGTAIDYSRHSQSSGLDRLRQTN